MIKAFVAQYLTYILAGVLVAMCALVMALYMQRNSAQHGLMTAQAKVAAIEADRERIKNLRDEATAKNLELVNAARLQNESIELARKEAEKQKQLIAVLQAQAAKQAEPHYTRIAEIKAVPMGVNTCDNLKLKIDAAIKPYVYF